MAKAFSDAERERIYTRLLEEGRGMFTKIGIRKTAVEDLAEAVGIAKGTFYRFFPSKIDLCLRLLEEEEKRKWELVRPDCGDSDTHVAPSPGDAHAAVRDFFKRARSMIEGSEMVRAIYRRGEFEYLLRSFSDERMRENRSDDDEFSRALIARWREFGIRSAVSPGVLTALIRSLFFASLHGEEVGEGHREAMDILFEEAARAVTGEGGDDV